MKNTHNARRVLFSLFGTERLTILLVVLFFLITIGLITNAVFDLLWHLLGTTMAKVLALLGLSFSLFTMLIWLRHRAAKSALEPTLSMALSEPGVVTTLVQVLGPLASVEQWQQVESAIKEQDNRLADSTPWHMNLLGIKDRINKLPQDKVLRLVVLADTVVIERYFSLFKRYLVSAIPDPQRLVVLSAQDFAGSGVGRGVVNINHMDEVFMLLQAVKQRLQNAKADQSEPYEHQGAMLVDVTSGHKLATIACSMVALYKDLHIQYVSKAIQDDGGHALVVKTYNVQYEENNMPFH